MTEADLPGPGMRSRREWRARLARRPGLELCYRVTVGVAGTVVLALGVVAIPYPGPGWLIVFAGLGILASEFAWARRTLSWVKARYDRTMVWLARLGWWAQAAGVVFTAAVVVLTLWVLGTFGLVAGWLGIDRPWLHSPL